MFTCLFTCMYVFMYACKCVCAISNVTFHTLLQNNDLLRRLLDALASLREDEITTTQAPPVRTTTSARLKKVLNPIMLNSLG